MGAAARSKNTVREPVRIKVYGLVYMTRRGYTLLLSIGVVLALGLIAVRLGGLLPLAPVEKRNITVYDTLAYGLLANLHWIVLGALVLGGIEAFFVLQRFSREELMQRALLDEHPASDGGAGR